MLYWLVPFLAIVILWLAVFIYINDFSVPTFSTSVYKNILVIFPHPDDEVLTASGYIQEVVKHGGTATIHVLTKGENGTPDAHLDESLKETRTLEMQRVARILGADVVIDDLGDGKLSANKDSVYARVTDVISKIKPDLVISYDLSGMYGHEDHIVLSETITDFIHNSLPQTTLWYASQPLHIYNKLNLPEHMAKDKEFASKRSVPTHKVFVGLSVINKVRSLYAHKSQYQSFRNGIPGKPIPMWFFVSTGLFEYFSEVN